MAAPACSEEHFIALWHQLGSPQAISQALGINVRTVHQRRKRLEAQGVRLDTTNTKGNRVEFDKDSMEAKLKERIGQAYTNVRKGITMEKGRVIVFSDAHIIPNYDTTASRALIEIIKEFKPEVIVCNGDAFDGQRLSRFPRIGWEETYTVKQELDACVEYLGEVEAASKFKSNFSHDNKPSFKISNLLTSRYGVVTVTNSESQLPIMNASKSASLNSCLQSG